MLSYGNIVILHPAAIGDAMLATPVAQTLKLNYPAARITYWSHPVLRQLLLGLNPNVDEFVDYSKEAGFFGILKTLKRLEPDLFVDLSNSSKLKLLPWFTRIPTLRYQKQKAGTQPIMHAVDNFLMTVQDVCPDKPAKIFPSIFPEALAPDVLAKISDRENFLTSPLIALVPGVGKFRPHRAWIYDGWIYLINYLHNQGAHRIILIGGEDDAEICERLQRETSNVCLNAAGILSLSETAAVLKRCEVVVSGDTGPAHLAVAVGTPVVGLYGATFSQRSGPYGCADLTIDQSNRCVCVGEKFCKVNQPGGPGECMHRIMLPDVIEKIDFLLKYGRNVENLQSLQD